MCAAVEQADTLEMNDEFAVVSDVNGDEDEDENVDADSGSYERRLGLAG